MDGSPKLLDHAKLDTPSLRPVVLLVTGDLTLVQQVEISLGARRSRFLLPLAPDLPHARQRVQQLQESGVAAGSMVIVFDSSDPGPLTWLATATALCAIAPVVALLRRGQGLEWLQTWATNGSIDDGDACALKQYFIAGRLELVWREGPEPSLLRAMIERHTCGTTGRNTKTGTVSRPVSEIAEDFGEAFRHELNNPLTGILGNAELLLGRRDQLAPAMVSRLETITELAIRLRETVRRLSHELAEKLRNQELSARE
jgi:signal transduction histidine kinase